MATLSVSASERPPANAWREAGRAKATVRPIWLAQDATRIAKRLSNGNGSGQRTGCRPCSAAVRSMCASAMLRSSAHRNASQLSAPGRSRARTGTHSTPGWVCSARSAATYAAGEARSKKKAGASAVDEPAIRSPSRLHDRLAQRRVAVDDARELRVAALQQLDVDELLDELRRLRADDVAAQQLAVALIADDFVQAAAVAVDRAGPNGAVLDLADGDVVAGLARLLLGQPERRDVRVAEGRARDVDVLDRVRLEAGGVLDGDDPLVGGLVGQGRTADEVADGPHAVGAGAQRAVDLDEPVLTRLDARLVEPEPLDVGAAAGGDDEPVGLAGLALEGEGAARVGGLDVLHERAGVHLDPLLLEAALGELGDVGVLGRQHAVERLEEGDLHAEARVGRGDLGARCAGADDDHGPGQLLERPRLLGADHALAELRAGDGPLDRSRGQHDALRRVDLVAVLARADAHGARAGQRAVALEVVDLVLLEQPGDAPGQRLDHLGAALHDGAEVDLRVADPDAVFAGVAYLVEHVGHAQHGLGRDAGVVQAAPADHVLLDHGGLHAELGGADRGDVAARTRADDDAVVLGVSHRAPESNERAAGPGACPSRG